MILPFAWAVAIPAGIAIACLLAFSHVVKLANNHLKTGCLVMATTALAGLAAISALVVFLAQAPVYIARGAGERVHFTRSVVLGSPIRILGNGDRQQLSARWEGSLLVNDTPENLRIRRVLYNVHWIPPGLLADNQVVVRSYTVMPLRHRLHHFGEGDEPPDQTRVEKGQQADARYQVTW